MDKKYMCGACVAEDLRRIADIIGRMKDAVTELPNQQFVVVLGVLPDTSLMLDVAAALENCYPIEPLTEEQKKELFDWVYDQMGDMSQKEHAHEYLDNMSPLDLVQEYRSMADEDY